MRVATHSRSFERSQTFYDWQHYISLLERKPGGLRNGAPFEDMPQPLKQLQAILLRREGGDSVMAQVLAAVPLHGLDAVLVATELALEAGKPSGEHVLNVMARLKGSEPSANLSQAMAAEFGDDHARAALRSIIEVGTSAGGARAKAVIAWSRETNEIKAGQLDAPEGFEYWLLKFDGMGQDNELGASGDYGRIEYAYYLMAIQAGLSMMECRLLEENGRAHFMTKRFDRDSSGLRHHLQTLCAMSHLDYKRKGVNSYSQLFSTIQALGLPYEQKEEAFRRMVFNVMGRNCDDHTKNISFRLRQGHAWELAPAYDVTFAHNPKGEWTRQHLMSVNGKLKDFILDDLLEVGDRFAIGSAKSVIAQVRDAIKQWPHFAAQAKLSELVIDDIQKQHVLCEK